MSKIRIRNGPYANREVTLADQAISIGRDVEAGLTILDRSASRFHAEVLPVGGMFFVRDMDSKNGTYVNSDKLEDEELLREGDIIKIGATELVFESGMALNESDSGDQVAYDDDIDLGNTIEFRIDDLSDIEDESLEQDDAVSLRLLYQVGKTLNGSSSDPCAKMLDLLVTALPVDHAIVLMRQGTSSKLVPKYVRAAERWSKPVIARSIVKKVMSDNRAVLTKNAQEDQRFNQRHSIVIGKVRSVICVPLGQGGNIKGVLYLSRDGGHEPFIQGDLELLSACAIQLAMYFTSQEQAKKQKLVVWQSMKTMVHIMELRSACVGRGKRSARAAQAIAGQLQVSEKNQRHVRYAALLHHIGTLSSEDGSSQALCMELLAGISGFKTIVSLIEQSSERTDGSGPLGLEHEELGYESRIVTLAVAFEQHTRGNYDQDVLAVIDDLEKTDGFDVDVMNALRQAHIDGSLYALSQKKDAASTIQRPAVSTEIASENSP